MGTSHCSQKQPSCALTQVVHLTTTLASRAALQIRNGPFTWLCCEPTISTQVVIHPTIVTCLAHTPITEQPVWWSCREKGKTFWAHKHLFQRSKQSLVSKEERASHHKGVSNPHITVATHHLLTALVIQPCTMPRRISNCKQGCARGCSTPQQLSLMPKHHYIVGTSANKKKT